MEDLEIWFAEYLALNRDLGMGVIGQEAWRDGIDRLFLRCKPAKLLQRIDLDALGARLKRDVTNKSGEIFHTLLVDGAPPERPDGAEPARVVITKIAHVAKGRSIPPHGHSNMVSAFLHLSGEFQVRLFDKLFDTSDALVIRPGADFVGGSGLWSSVSDYRNNIHWLTARSDDCFLFTTKMIGLDKGKPTKGRINLDLKNIADLGGGLLMARKISCERAAELYDES
jgi:hypothetical protein